MPEIVIPDLSHSLCLEQFRKTLCDVVGLDQIANLIDTYILKIFLDVAASAQAAVFLLFFFQRKKSFPHERNKRQCPHKNAVIDQKLRQFFDGKIVRKDLTKKIKEGANVPVYLDILAFGDSYERAEVVSYLLADGRLDKLKEKINGRDAA